MTVRLLYTAQAGLNGVLTADDYLFATSEDLIAISGQLRDPFDHCYYPVLNHINSHPYVCPICTDSDGQNAVHQIKRITTGWRLRPMAESIIVCAHT